MIKFSLILQSSIFAIFLIASTFQSGTKSKMDPIFPMDYMLSMNLANLKETGGTSFVQLFTIDGGGRFSPPTADFKTNDEYIAKSIQFLESSLKQWSFIESQLLEPNANIAMPELQTPLRHFTTTLELLANIKISIGQYSESIKHLEKACPLVELLSANYFLSFEVIDEAAQSCFSRLREVYWKAIEDGQDLTIPFCEDCLWDYDGGTDSKLDYDKRNHFIIQNRIEEIREPYLSIRKEVLDLRAKSSSNNGHHSSNIDEIDDEDDQEKCSDSDYIEKAEHIFLESSHHDHSEFPSPILTDDNTEIYVINGNYHEGLFSPVEASHHPIFHKVGMNYNAVPPNSYAQDKVVIGLHRLVSEFVFKDKSGKREMAKQVQDLLQDQLQNLRAVEGTDWIVSLLFECNTLLWRSIDEGMSFVESELLAKEKEEAAAGDGSGNDEPSPQLHALRSFFAALSQPIYLARGEILEPPAPATATGTTPSTATATDSLHGRSEASSTASSSSSSSSSSHYRAQDMEASAAMFDSPSGSIFGQSSANPPRAAVPTVKGDGISLTIASVTVGSLLLSIFLILRYRPGSRRKAKVRTPRRFLTISQRLAVCLFPTVTLGLDDPPTLGTAVSMAATSLWKYLSDHRAVTSKRGSLEGSTSHHHTHHTRHHSGTGTVGSSISSTHHGSSSSSSASGNKKPAVGKLVKGHSGSGSKMITTGSSSSSGAGNSSSGGTVLPPSLPSASSSMNSTSAAAASHTTAVPTKSTHYSAAVLPVKSTMKASSESTATGTTTPTATTSKNIAMQPVPPRPTSTSSSPPGSSHPPVVSTQSQRVRPRSVGSELHPPPSLPLPLTHAQRVQQLSPLNIQATDTHRQPSRHSMSGITLVPAYPIISPASITKKRTPTTTTTSTASASTTPMASTAPTAIAPTPIGTKGTTTAATAASFLEHKIMLESISNSNKLHHKLKEDFGSRSLSSEDSGSGRTESEKDDQELNRHTVISTSTSTGGSRGHSTGTFSVISSTRSKKNSIPTASASASLLEYKPYDHRTSHTTPSNGFATVATTDPMKTVWGDLRSSNVMHGTSSTTSHTTTRSIPTLPPVPLDQPQTQTACNAGDGPPDEDEYEYEELSSLATESQSQSTHKRTSSGTPSPELSLGLSETYDAEPSSSRLSFDVTDSDHYTSTTTTATNEQGGGISLGSYVICEDKLARERNSRNNSHQNKQSVSSYGSPSALSGPTANADYDYDYDYDSVQRSQLPPAILNQPPSGLYFMNEYCDPSSNHPLPMALAPLLPPSTLHDTFGGFPASLHLSPSTLTEAIPPPCNLNLNIMEEVTEGLGWKYTTPPMLLETHNNSLFDIDPLQDLLMLNATSETFESFSGSNNNGTDFGCIGSTSHITGPAHSLGIATSSPLTTAFTQPSHDPVYPLSLSSLSPCTASPPSLHYSYQLQQQQQQQLQPYQPQPSAASSSQTDDSPLPNPPSISPRRDCLSLPQFDLDDPNTFWTTPIIDTDCWNDNLPLDQWIGMKHQNQQQQLQQQVMLLASEIALTFSLMCTAFIPEDVIAILVFSPLLPPSEQCIASIHPFPPSESIDSWLHHWGYITLQRSSTNPSLWGGSFTSSKERLLDTSVAIYRYIAKDSSDRLWQEVGEGEGEEDRSISAVMNSYGSEYFGTTLDAGLEFEDIFLMKASLCSGTMN